MLKKYTKRFGMFVDQAGVSELAYIRAFEDDRLKTLCGMDRARNLYIKAYGFSVVLRISPVLILKAVQKKYIDKRLFGCKVDNNIIDSGTLMAIVEYIQDIMDDPEVDPEKLAKEYSRYDAKDSSELKKKMTLFASSVSKTDEDFLLALVTIAALSRIRLDG